MPATARQTSRTGLPGGRSEISFRWTPKAIKQLLELVKNTPDYRATFFHKGLTVRKKSGIARELLLDLVKDEPDYIAFLRARRMIKKDERDRWVPLDTWTSAFNNPASSKLHDLKRTYAKARDEYKIKSHWTKFADLPNNIRRDFLGLYPWYFIYKELDSPTEPFERPPLRISDPPPATIQSPASETTRSAVRRRRHELPSPSPSDRPTPEPSPSPSDHSTPEPSPPPAPTSSRSFLNLTPTIAAPPIRTTSSFTLGVRPYLRPNAVASSSQIPIEVDTSSSSSSASSSESESESEHEMETYTPEVPPPRSPSPPADVDWLGNGRFPAPSRSVSVGSKSNRAQTPSSARACQAGPSRRLSPQSDSDSESDSSIDLDPAPETEVKTEASEPYVAHIDIEEQEHKPNISDADAGQQERTTTRNMPHLRSDRRRERSLSSDGEPLDAQPIKRARHDESPSPPSDFTPGSDEECADMPGPVSSSLERRDARVQPSQEQEQIVTVVNFPCPCCKPGEMSSDITAPDCLKARQIRLHFYAASMRIHPPPQINQRVALVLKYAKKQFSAYKSATDVKNREGIISGVQHRLLIAVLRDMLALGVVPRHVLDDCVLCLRQADAETVTAAAVQVMRPVAQIAGAVLSIDKRLFVTALDRGERISVSNTHTGWYSRTRTRGYKFRKVSLRVRGHLAFGAYLYRKLVQERSRPEGGSDVLEDNAQGASAPEAEPDLDSDYASRDDTVDLKHDTGASIALWRDATVPEQRDILMRRLRRAVASDLNDPEVIFPDHRLDRESYKRAPSENDKLKYLRKYRIRLFTLTLHHMRKKHLLPRLLVDCRLCFDPIPVEISDTNRHFVWRSVTSAAGAQQGLKEAQLAPGSRRLIRIHIRKDLDDFDVEPETSLAREPRSDGTHRKPLCVRQYSYLAFARFFYNRLCRDTDGDYEPLPPLAGD